MAAALELARLPNGRRPASRLASRAEQHTNNQFVAAFGALRVMCTACVRFDTCRP